ncbi:hypothetical protein DC522_29585 [Microvirga sp. KLBC 81]|uniref:DUF4336 domain-containing protein n=1 Tax=Microvirga sp. KLBC 81 TaxID=1862707 RepID=UPI000D516A9B|nr:DUF4336 domain-containing protein [Microvirga sp. KLBC 81]PVE20910.1 hypothetical protein DC522_29585 [Microvirga sp. KLBC 81]
MASEIGLDGTYPPLDVLKPVGDDVWIVDSGPLHVLGLTLPIRMTVLRLSSGDLWLHSPTRFTEELRAQLEQQGRITHLIAPDISHWSFLQEWQRNCPNTLTWAAPGLRERRQVQKAGIRIDYILSDTSPPEWAGELEQITVRGLGFSEVDFFHHPSRTLIMTDLVQNLETGRLPAFTRIMARLNGIAAPRGRAPIYLRLAVKANKREAARAATRLVEWQPERVIFSHGRWFERDGTEAVKRSLDWLTG